MHATLNWNPIRWLTVLFGTSLALMALPPAIASAQDTTDCDRGWRDVEVRDDIAAEGVALLSPEEVWVAGGSMLGGGRREASVLHGSGETWELELSPQPDMRDASFMGIASAGPGEDVWAVGYGRDVDQFEAITAVRDGDGWQLTDALQPDGNSATLVDVGAAPGEGIWAAGFIQGRPGQQRPWVLERADGKWRDSLLPLADGERATLAGISVSDQGGVWVAGTALAGPGMQPYLARHTDDGWQRFEVEAADGTAMADIEVTAPDSGWAVGHRLAGASIEPFIVRWDGSRWMEMAGPEVGPESTLLMSVSVAGDVVNVGGTTWDPQKSRYVPLAARFENDAWSISRGRGSWGMGTITDMAGDPGTSGWVVGHTDGGFIARTCVASPETPEPEPAPSLSQLSQHEVAPERATPTPLEGTLVALDVTAAAGLPTESQSWDAVAADFDNDGLDDLFLGRHGARARLFHNDGGVFVDTELTFGGGDRHGCVAGDVDDSGLLDLYCSFGASRGTGTKANQLWLDPGSLAPVLQPAVGGASEPLGRGRQARLLDIDEDGVDDLFLGQETKRMDGLPSTNRAFLRTTPAHFEATEVPGIDTGLAAESIDVADYDGDGREDILFVYWDKRAASGNAGNAGIRLYRNEEGLAFTDTTAKTGIESMADHDAALADFDGDGRPDLVQLSTDRLRVSLARDGRFKRVYERDTAGGTALATGDADGDGDTDIYILQAKSAGGAHDLILLNDGDGTSFGALDVPEVQGGSEDAVIALDYDADGRTDFLALNGRNSERGPVQLITLGPA